MATVKLILRIQQIDKNGEAPLYIRVTKDRKSRFITTGYKFKENQWDLEKQRVRKNFPNSARVNALLAQKIADAEGHVADLERKTKAVSGRRLKEAIKGKGSVNYFDFAYGRLEQMKSNVAYRTHRGYRDCIAKFEKYNGGRDLNFDDISVTLLKDYNNYCSNHLGNNNTTIKLSMTILGKFFKDAIKEDLVDANLYPFDKIQIKKEAAKRMFLNKEQIQQFRNIEVNPDSKAPIIKDMFLFAVYAGGLRLSDVLELQWQNINLNENRITKTIRKTGRFHSFKIGSVAVEILTKYNTKEAKDFDFVFPMLENGSPFFANKQYANAEIERCTSLCSLHLKNISNALKFPFSLSFHLSRHTFATNALNNGMRIEHVSKLMDHSDIGITQIYAKIISQELDDAVEKFVF